VSLVRIRYLRTTDPTLDRKTRCSILETLDLQTQTGKRVSNRWPWRSAPKFCFDDEHASLSPDITRVRIIMAVRATIGPDCSHAYAMSSISGPVLPIVNATYLTLAPHSPIALFTGFHLSFHHGRPSATHPSPSLSCSPHPRTFHRIRILSPQSGVEDALASTTESSTGTMPGPRSTGVTYRASPGVPSRHVLRLHGRGCLFPQGHRDRQYA
jgi:hypothetical protein